MSSDWRTVKLSEVAIEVTVGFVGTMTNEYIDHGIPFLRSLNVDRFKINSRDIRYVSRDFHSRISKSRLIPGDVVIVRTGKPGTCAVIPEELPESNCSDLVIVRCGSEILNRFFCYYVNSAASNHIAAHLVGAVQQHFNVASAKTMEIPLPPIQEQKAIAHILGTLDDKIELNRKTNETLEAMAKALFKSWFVDFDPVRAKAEDRPTGLPAEISDLFPDSFEDSKLGEIPSGWSIVQLGDLIELAYGKPLKEEQRNGGIYSVFGSNGVVGSHDDYLVEAPGIVIGRKGNPGTVEWSERNFYPIDTTFFVVNKKTGLGMRFLFYSLKNQNLADLSADSAVPGLNRNHAYLNAQMLPPAKVACAFESYSEVIFKRREVLADEIIALSATRDALLPKLISGEICIPDAEKLLEEVGI
jgi:type I restriction enzyme S subunit